MPKWILFAVLCIVGISALIYFASVSASESIPAYSTLNTKPEGAKLLFDGLAASGLVQVSRQFKDASPKNATIFFLGNEPFSLQFERGAWYEEKESLAGSGNRLILAVLSSRNYPKATFAHWGLHIVKSELQPDNSWTPIAAQVWLRKFGTGEIILVGNGQRLSNKGIAVNPDNRLLLQQLVSAHPIAIFEESHLGIRETGSIAGLARHYRLQGLLAGLILLAALFIWSRSVSFPPVRPSPDKTLLGSDTRSMLAELMSRHLQGELIPTCVVEWNRTHSHSGPLEAPAGGSTVQLYNQLQATLEGKTPLRK